MLARTRQRAKVDRRSQPCGNRVKGAPAPILLGKDAAERYAGRAAVAFSCSRRVPQR
jgi:hypothetical protein